MSFEQMLNLIARKAGATVNPEFLCRMEGLQKADFMPDDEPLAGSIMCVQDASKIASLSFYSGWVITVGRGKVEDDTPMQKLYINGVLVLEGIHRNKVAEVKGMVYRGLIGRLRSAHTGQRGV